MRGDGLQTRCHYKGDNNDFVVLVESKIAVEKWRGDKSIAMTDVVDAYAVFATERHGSQGQLLTPNNADLENEFGTHNVDEVVKVILEKGQVQESEQPQRAGNRNQTIGAGFNNH